MRQWLKSLVDFFIGDRSHERTKTILLACTFFLIIGSYTLIRELRDTIFFGVVGREHAALARIWSMFALIPAIFLFSRLVDLLKRHQLLYFYSSLYGIGLIVIAYFLADPTIGLANQVPSGDRVFGWVVYFFLEGYLPFVVSLFWSFVNSITTSSEAQTNYAFIIAGSKLGGMMASGIAFLWLTNEGQCGISIDIINHQILFTVAGSLLLLVPFLINTLINKVPLNYLHGYEAAYAVDKQIIKEQKKEPGIIAWFKGMTSGLVMIFRYPYVMGIFGTVFFWEVIKAVLSYQRLVTGQEATTTTTEFTCYLLKQTFFLHTTGLVIVLFGTRTIVAYCGERISLLLVPLITGILMIYYFASNSAEAIGLVYIIANAVNYAFASPLREALYIPTTREMKFKSKSWIDSFGSKIGKGCGATYNAFMQSFAASTALVSNTIFFTVIIGAWLLTSQFLGRRFERSLKSNEVIGFD